MGIEMNVYRMFKEIDDKNIEQLLYDMKTFAVIYGLEDEFVKEILHSPHFDKLCLGGNDALVKRFGYFVLEHLDDVR
jgi:hypothetical protein